MNRKILFPLGSLVLLVILLIGLEIYLRLTTSYIVQGSNDGFLLTQSYPEALIVDTPAGRRLVPNIKATILNHYLSHQNTVIETNQLGFRDQDLGNDKRERDLRILALGDSITLGDYLQANQVYVERLEDYLNHFQSKKQISVINAGVVDIGIKEEVAILQEKGLGIKPDIVLVALYLNDSRPPWGFPQEVGHKGWLRRQSVLINRLYEGLIWREWIKQKGIDRFNWKGGEKLNWQQDRAAFLQFAKMAKYDWGAAWEEDSWPTVDEEFKKLHSLSQTNGFKVVVVAFPVIYQINSDFLENTPQRILQQKTKDLGFYYIDLLPILRENRNQDLYFDWAHPKEFANDLIGKYIADFFISSVLTE
ncbi:hypothetical protein HYS94_01200 [Candidatus Daviesbacteria bacterium]|nr:hypothetical protein [Candidatus Daviesbacteria bacterium]